ncbi:MAG TPA: galactose oxidase early set domain-containing protein [Lacipirellulaceae bacterium]|nr:galactose oxidase early set domain-containing protein [Lacipirellulaceae bacterium]
MTLNSQRLFQLVLACAMAATLAGPLRAQPNVNGQWTDVFSWGRAGGVEAIHMMLLPTGKVMFWQYSASSIGLWDPVTAQFSAAARPAGGSQPYLNPFCSGHAWLADGRLLVAGGHIENNDGDNRANIYDPFANTWANNVPDMPSVPAGAPYGVGRNGRWYPSATTLGNGDVLVLSGDMNGSVSGQSDTHPLPQVYEAATNSWRNLTTAYNELPLYPRTFLAPDGSVYSLSDYSGRTERLNTNGTGSWTTVANTFYDERVNYGSAAMYDSGKVVFIGGGDSPAATAEVIDLNRPNPTWSYTAGNMAQPRRQHNATILADGTVLVTGGSSASGFNNPAGQVGLTEIWNPATGLFTPVAPASSVYRGYHTTALLLPDGRVIMAGGNHDNPNYTENRNAEIYSPPYLFKGPRPNVTAAPDTAELGRSFYVQTPDAASIADVLWIVPGAVTHSQDWTQRANHLEFAVVEGGLAITLPSNPNAAPLGFYMLFLINNNGVPSIAEWVRATLPGPGLPGDFNGDGAVDAADYVVWRKGLGTEYTEGDYDAWRENFGVTAGAASTSASTLQLAVPEPTSGWATIAALCWAGAWRRREG